MSSLARLAVLISGHGSNMLAIAKACASGELPAIVVRVISDRPDAAGLQAASELGLATQVVDRRQYASRDEFEAALHAEFTTAKPDWIALAGFMRILGPELVAHWRGRIVNIHPSLLPKYPGLDTHARALAAGDPEHGASVHLVTETLDAGPLIEQVKVPVHPNDNVNTLASRVLAEEHLLYVRALARCLSGDNASIRLSNPSMPPESGK